MGHDAAWIETFTGKQFHILDPQPEDICIEDIAHALSHSCRFTGHTRKFYSVAEHSYLTSTLVPKQFALEALLHDASEAYIGDMSRPLKHFTEAGKYYKEIEHRIDLAIASKFGLPETMSPEVKKADNLMLYAEKFQLMTPLEWDTKWADTTEQAKVQIWGWEPERMENSFLCRFNVLQKSSSPKDLVQYP